MMAPPGTRCELPRALLSLTSANKRRGATSWEVMRSSDHAGRHDSTVLLFPLHTSRSHPLSNLGLVVLQSHLKCRSNQRATLPGPFSYPPILDHLKPILAPAEE